MKQPVNQPKDCRECKWFEAEPPDNLTICFHDKALYEFAPKERNQGTCGPSGKLWEKKENV